MLLGIDVGGTFTDAVIIDGGHHRFIGEAANHEGESHEWHNGCLRCGDAWWDPAQIEQVTLSTTVVTNTIVEHKEQPVDLYVVAGPGRNVDDIFPVRPVYLKGYTDHRGIVVERTDIKGTHQLANMVHLRVVPIWLLYPQNLAFAIQRKKSMLLRL